MITENKVTEIFGMEDKFCKFFDITTAKCKLKLLLRENISVIPRFCFLLFKAFLFRKTMQAYLLSAS